MYLIKCSCGLAYIGKTTQRVKDHMFKHKSTIRRKELKLPIPVHFGAHNNTVAQMRFQVIERIPLPEVAIALPFLSNVRRFGYIPSKHSNPMDLTKKMITVANFGLDYYCLFSCFFPIWSYFRLWSSTLGSLFFCSCPILVVPPLPSSMYLHLSYFDVFVFFSIFLD